MREAPAKAFTLIEILIVILIMGIVSITALFALGDFGGKRKAITTAEHLYATVQLLIHRAVISSETLGLSIDTKGYTIYTLKDIDNWQVINTPLALRPYVFSEPVRVTIKQNIAHNSIPNLIIGPTGTLSPIEIYFGTTSQPNVILFTSMRKEQAELIDTGKK